MDTTLSIIILSYNTRNLTTTCVKSVTNQYKEELESGELEVIIVDNDSSDGSAEEVSTLRLRSRENFKLIKNKKNLGFSKACNIGAKNAKGKYLLFLNSDTEVLDRGLLNMVEFLERSSKVGVLGGKIFNRDNSLQPSAGKFYNMFNFLLLLIGGEKFGWLRSSPQKIAKVDWVSGACFMISRKLFDRLRGFDEHFFMYMEDMELCFRAKLFGFPTYFYPNIKVVHQSLGSSNRDFAVRSIDKGILYFYKKHKSYWQYVLVKTLLMLKGAVRNTYS